MTDPQRIPCLGGPMDGQDAPQLVMARHIDVAYPVVRPYTPFFTNGGVQVDADINLGRYTLERYVRREWDKRYPTEQEMQEWERQMDEWHKPIHELSFFRQLAREIGNGMPPPMPRVKYIVRDRTAFAFVWEVAANGRTMRPGWEGRLRFDDPPWKICLEAEAMLGRKASP